MVFGPAVNSLLTGGTGGAGPSTGTGSSKGKEREPDVRDR